MKTHTFSPDILQLCDIRGIVDETLTAQDAFAIGYSFVKSLPTATFQTIAIARDGRESSGPFAKALIEGIQYAGFNAIDLGIGPTPLLFYGVHALNVDAGVMITGSHNPPQYNGFKFATKQGPFFGDQLKNFQSLAQEMVPAVTPGTAKSLDILDDYIAFILKGMSLTRPLKIVWDIGNGVTGAAVEKLAPHIPGEHIFLNMKSDIANAHHHPDPSVEKNMLQLQKTVLDHNADLGFAFDGDGDRIGAVDPKGTIWYGEDLAYVFAEDILGRHKNAKIIYDVKITDALPEMVRAQGGMPLINRTGHAFIKERLLEEKALFAAEYSGHLYFKEDYIGADDGLYAALRLLKILDQSGKSLSTYYDAMPRRHSIPEGSQALKSHAEKHVIIKNIKAALAQKKIAYTDLDGIRVNVEDGWWLIRASNTSPALSYRAEGHSTASLARIAAEVQQYLPVNTSNVAE